MNAWRLAALAVWITTSVACTSAGGADVGLDAGASEAGASEAGASEDAFDAGDTALDAWGSDLELGTGLASFESLPSSGGRLELVAGPQGGWHVYLSMRVRRLVPSGLTYRVTRVSDGAVLADLSLDARAGSFVAQGDALERVGDQVILFVVSPSDVVGGEVLVEGTVHDTSAASRMASLRALVVDEVP